MDQNSLDNLT